MGDSVNEQRCFSSRFESLTDAGAVLRLMRDSEGEKVYWKMKALHAVYKAFAINARELLARIAFIENPANKEKLWNWDRQEPMEAAQLDASRLLQNFLTSALVLRDHTTVIVKELYKDHGFQKEYQAKVAESFTSSPVAGFVQKLRNWMSHRGLVPLTVQMSFPNGFGLSEVLLNLEQLRQYDDWDARAKSFLATLSSHPRLADVVKSYIAVVEPVYVWLERRMNEIHADAFQEFRELQVRLEQLQAHVKERARAK